MSTTALLILGMVIVVIAVGVVLYLQRRRSDALRAQFGPEYQHAVEQFGDEREAEADLAAWRASGMRNQNRRLQ
jgi:preprotein translocase subunit SecG